MPSKFSSKVLEVFAETGERFSIHESILKSLSEKLDQMLMTSDKELELGLDLSSWNEATVERLIEYAYTGDYHCPNPVPLGTPSSGPGPVVDNDDSKSQPTKPVKTTPVPENTDTARPLTPLHECFHAGPDPEEKFSQAEIYREIHLDPSRHDFKETFLAHAQLYSLARHFEIEALWTLALQRLMRTLIDINFIKSNYRVASNFTDLVKFSYEKTSSPEDPLRRIISQFAALFFTNLQNEDMKDCIKQCGDFASELMGKVCRRLMVTEINLEEKQYSHMCELAAERERNKRLEKLLTPIAVNSKPDLGDTKSASSVPATGGLFGSTSPIPSVSRPSSPAVGGSGGSEKPLSSSTSGTTNTGSGNPVSSSTSGTKNPGSSAKSIFESVNSIPAATGGLFGGTKPTTPPANSGLFGGSQPSSSAPTAGGIFGNTKPASGSTQPANPTPTAAGLFGSAKPVPGATRPDSPAAGSTFGSGFGTRSSSSTTGGLFGAQPTNSTPTYTSLFSIPAPTSTNTTTGGSFGQSTNSTPASTGLFGKPTPASTNTTTSGFFGAQPKKHPSPFDTFPYNHS